LNKYLKITLLSLILFALFSAGSLFAQQLVYHPVNPSFGGSPLNGNWLLSSAQLQDNNKDPDAVDQTEQDPFADFQDNLNRAVLSQLSRALTNSIFGEGGDLQEGIFELGDFSIEIIETIDGIQIIIFDIITGNETTILVPFP